VYLDESDDQLKLPINFAAIEVTNSGTQLVDDKTLFVQLLITLQSPEEIIAYITEFISGGES
jgi:hypothetical protein